MFSRRRTIFHLLVAVFLLSLIARPTPAWACSCIAPPAPDQAFTDTGAVFIGQVTNISNISKLPGVGLVVSTLASWTQTTIPYTFYDNKVSFNVIDSWKGVTTTSVTISTAEGGASCGFTFVTGQQYVVYAYDTEDGILQTNICTRTSELASAAPDLAFLGAKHQVALTSAPFPLWPLVAGLAVVFIIAIAAAGFFYRWVSRGRVRQK
jgi:hypothetical protein